MPASSAESHGPRIPEIDPEQRQRVIRGDLTALDALVRAMQPGVYNLALRMLGQRDDALDASQDIVVRVVTQLATYRSDTAFSTWVYRIARNVLLTAATRAREAPDVSFDDIDAKLATGLTVYHATIAPLSPLDEAEARDVALYCTQGMLLALDRDQRLAYVLDIVFGLTSDQAASVFETTPATHRQRLSRAKTQLHDFMQHTCGLVSEDASCRCHRQLPAVRKHRAASMSPSGSRVLLPVIDEAALRYEQLVEMFDAVAVMRAQPAYTAPEALTAAIREALTASGWPTTT